MRINLYAGPGAGKSTTSSWLFAEMKKLGYSVELVSEYVKSWAIAKRDVIGFDQVYLMGKQLQYEYRFLAHGIQNIVTDSPVLLSACYTRSYFNDLKIADHMEAIIAEYESRHPSLNIFLERGNKEYRTEGRWQTPDEALRMDDIIQATLDRNAIAYSPFSFYDSEGILDYVTQNIAKP
jgi:hypothetical protein